jgi:hypothetical protein
VGDLQGQETNQGPPLLDNKYSKQFVHGHVLARQTHVIISMGLGKHVADFQTIVEPVHLKLQPLAGTPMPRQWTIPLPQIGRKLYCRSLPFLAGARLWGRLQGQDRFETFPLWTL